MMNEEPRRVCQPRDTSVMRLTKVGSFSRRSFEAMDAAFAANDPHNAAEPLGDAFRTTRYKRKELAGVGLEIFETPNTNPAAAEFDDVAALEIVEDGGCRLARGAD